MRLGFHYHIPAMQEGGQTLTPGYQGRFIDALAKHFEEVTCFLHTPMPWERERMDYALLPANVRVVDMGPHESVMRRILKSRRSARRVRAQSGDLDLMLIRGPTPLLPVVARAAKGARVALLVVGDYTAGTRDLRQARWRRELIRLWALWNKRQQTQTARQSLTFVNSQELYEHLRDEAALVLETRTTTLSELDFVHRDDACQRPPYHLLYTGRMDHAKGLFVILEALAILSGRGEEVLLDLVGWPARGDPIMNELRQSAGEKGVLERVCYHGYKAVGPELFRFYRQADIYVTASLTTEGFPRTIWEAMAHSLPIVATRVGSIAAVIEGAAELASPGNAGELASAITRLIHNPALRKRLVKNGLELARQSTLEKQVEKMSSAMHAWAGKSVE